MKHLTRNQWAELIEEFESSGLTQAAFASQKGVKLPTLRSWVYKLRTEQPLDSSAPELLPVRLLEPERSSRELLELEFPSGHRLRFPAGTAPSYLAALVASLG